MKIPLDFFLRLIEKFLSEQQFDKVIKKLRKHFEAPEEDFSDILSDLSLQEIISKYVKDNKELKKKLKAKSKKFLEENKINEEEDAKEEKEEKEQLTTKKRKRTMSSAKEEEKEEKPKKKRKRTMSSTKDELKIDENEENEEKKEKKDKKEKKEKPKRKRTMSSIKEDNEKEKEKSSKKRKKTEEKDDEEDEKEEKKEKKKKKKNEDDEDIDLEKEVKFIPKPKSDSNPNRVPFKRIDESNINYQVPKNMRDNSYAAFMKQTGDDFGKAANDKLIATRGKGFRKEKTKFKNKTFHGGMTISTSVRSIPLEDDSSSDDNK